MNRKNLTAAVMAGLAGIAGIAGTAQAVNMNPDGLGEVLIYSYYTSNDGNQTLLSVVNTTDEVKAVKVRFLEGYNSREVLDFNLYLSPEDVWVATIADKEGVPTLLIPDNSCTVPYLYGMGEEEYGMGVQPFLTFAYTGDFEDGGPTGIERASEGYFEVVEMGTVDNSECRLGTEVSNTSEFPCNIPAEDDDDEGRMGSAEAATHVLDTETGEEVPADCDLLVRNWTDYEGSPPDTLDGHLFENAIDNGDCDPEDPDDFDGADCKTDNTDINDDARGGLFGGAAIVNVANGTMYSYDAKAIQGYNADDDGVHYIPGTIHPSLNDGDQDQAFVFFGAPNPAVVQLDYASNRTIDAVSATMMHDFVMNEFIIEADLAAATEWVFTFPTKNFYVDPLITGSTETEWHPDPDDTGCNGWDDGEYFPGRDGPDPEDDTTGTYNPPDFGLQTDWMQCTYIDTDSDSVIAPFTSLFGDEDCEVIGFESWNRNEVPTVDVTGVEPPIVSPAPPTPPTPGVVPFLMCHEVNIMRFGPEHIFGTTSDLLITVDNTHDDGWARMDFNVLVDDDEDDDDDTEDDNSHEDSQGMLGLPVIGFAAWEFQNGFLIDGVLANYGGLFGHKSSVDCDDCREF
jgi:hypothetical protein